MRNLKLNGLLMLTVFSLPAVGLDTDRSAKIVIQGPGCVSKLKLNQTECQKGLTIEQGSLLIRSSYGLIHHQGKGVTRVEMKGQQVYMEQLMENNDKMVIKADEIDYLKAEDKVFLTGNVSITSAIGVTTGEAIEFDLQTQEITAAGEDTGQQFKMVIDQNDD
ncbi:LptA/OstA family protein [Marinicella sediminis]|uniref:LptA/OstA family protein n=1 Tax=Marinicella sediminis TaxID=1792834 RepID=A0ABV7J904_9GAMM|nr:LptA/OstA family protein [Marinicella sediminis]